MKKILAISMAVILTFALSGCGTKGQVMPRGTETKTATAESQTDTKDETQAETSAETPVTESTGTVYPLTVKNYTKAEGGTEWKEKDITFNKAPERIVATTRTAAEFLIHLGLADKIVGVGGVFGEPDKAVETEFNKLTDLGKSYISKEVAMSVNPDFIFGRGGLFDNADWGVGTVDDLNEMGIKTYVMESSVTSGTFDSIYKDIDMIGKIFNVPEEANKFADELRARQQAVVETLSVIKDDKTFAYIHTSDPESLLIYSAYNETFFNDMFRMLKLQNVFEEVQGDVSVESLIEENPDVIITLQWDTEGEDATQTDEQVTMNQVLTNPKLESLDAIKNKQVFVANYNHLFGYSYQSLDGLEKLARQLYPDLFQ
ncbi:ABC transporter substrate-binding protein [Anaerocolumna sp. MB42-C2]|uniref:ABC transporter substrate-binding protein n=1 Tax=Anaerocolumna sp. MB42-C2 TaxID=3070997 RepID=UPI0027E11CB2|nr:ABC transporter substrate-binding protein [Anaerocolumna sp. MB42-C2]WMJ89076.1 ABC transporter substrate-binding protein [Anaerocolumna sp. MB42-C2]